MAVEEGALPSAGVLRRFGAMLYDTLLIIALLMVVTALLLAFTQGEAITNGPYDAVEFGYQALLVTISIGFFVLFWTRRGQTLGMQAWRLKVMRDNGATMSWGDAMKRLVAALVSLAPLGLGYFWIWIDRDKLAWHDRWTHTRVVVLPKK